MQSARLAAVDYFLPHQPALAAAAPSQLESHHPEIASAVQLLWGHAEMNLYFDRIWSGEALALSLHPDALSDLMVLAQIHRRLWPDAAPSVRLPSQARPRSGDPWDGGFRR
jgi:hypothetical protein